MIGDTMDGVETVISNADAFACGADSAFYCYYSLAGTALIASAVILAFVYIWSVLFRDQNLTNYVKIEINELFISAIIAFMMLGLVQSVADIPISTVLPQDFMPADVGSDENLYVATQKYFQAVDQDMATWLQLNYILNIYADSFASVTPYARPLGLGVVASPLAGFAAPLKQMLYNMTVGLSVAFIINYAQLYVFVFFVAAFLKYYFPIGVFLRCFTPTRRVGGALLGITATFLFIYPAITVLNFGMFYSEDHGTMETFRDFLGNYMIGSRDYDAVDPDDASISSGIRIHARMAEFYQENMTGGITDLVVGGIGGLGLLLQRVIGSLMLVIMILPLSIIGRAFAIGFIMPTITILVFVHAGKYLSKSLGEEIDLTALTRMI
jgi:hypothetical protein